MEIQIERWKDGIGGQTDDWIDRMKDGRLERSDGSIGEWKRSKCGPISIGEYKSWNRCELGLYIACP